MAATKADVAPHFKQPLNKTTPTVSNALVILPDTQYKQPLALTRVTKYIAFKSHSKWQKNLTFQMLGTTKYKQPLGRLPETQMQTANKQPFGVFPPTTPPPAPPLSFPPSQPSSLPQRKHAACVEDLRLERQVTREVTLQAQATIADLGTCGGSSALRFANAVRKRFLRLRRHSVSHNARYPSPLECACTDMHVCKMLLVSDTDCLFRILSVCSQGHSNTPPPQSLWWFFWRCD